MQKRIGYLVVIELTVIKVTVWILDPLFSLQPSKMHYYLASNTILFITAQNNTITITLS